VGVSPHGDRIRELPDEILTIIPHFAYFRREICETLTGPRCDTPRCVTGRSVRPSEPLPIVVFCFALWRPPPNRRVLLSPPNRRGGRRPLPIDAALLCRPPSSGGHSSPTRRALVSPRSTFARLAKGHTGPNALDRWRRFSPAKAAGETARVVPSSPPSPRRSSPCSSPCSSLRSLCCPSARPAPPGGCASAARQPLHLRRSRPWAHMLAPPQSLHSLRRRPCGHLPAPRQSLHVPRSRSWTQMLPPLQMLPPGAVPVVLADARPAAVSADASAVAVGADAGTPALPADASSPSMGALWLSPPPFRPVRPFRPFRRPKTKCIDRAPDAGPAAQRERDCELHVRPHRTDRRLFRELSSRSIVEMTH